MKQAYISALLEMLSSSTDSSVVIKQFHSLLQRKGHAQLFGPVLRGVLRIIEARKGTSTTVAVASVNAFSAQQSAIETALKQLGATGKPTISIDSSLIGGYVVTHNNIVIDASYKTKLLTLYRSLTS